ncbi:Cytochrome b6-f complex iron-sulfur subunit [Streptomyces netropsis]|uniref:Cytochrome bc1 complex Rieske iron-sulfur subunit n=1 Tax=Streptomyces syringium TaxID=76729 RepID=A0ABS4XZ02_9ACTN|nr:Rieske Fe-S protein [Streptomyces syringium]SPE47863.1 Cytochrome b6-f complex iron-sulfur subunit [Streptomyces netropsis]
MTHMSPAPGGASRRTVVAAVGATGLAAALAACGGSDDKATPPGTPDADATSGTAQQPSQPTSPPGQESSAAGPTGGRALARTSEIPVGGGKVFADRRVVVTQPSRGEFKAFSAICTHQKCVVKDVSDGTINCPCHGSKFSIEDGGVRHDPAKLPLPEMKISVRGDSIGLG